MEEAVKKTYGGLDISAYISTYEAYKSFPLTIEIKAEQGQDALVLALLLMRGNRKIPTISHEPYQGSFEITEPGEEITEEIAFQVYKHLTKPDIFVVEFKRASNDKCSYFTLLNAYKELYKEYYNVDYPSV